MTVLGTEAWITSAVDDKSVSKALILAGSLRRVHTGKKLAVVTTFGVAQELREKLKDAFDLVVLIEQDNAKGVDLEACAKVEGFSLLIFAKCVYLSPNAVVVKNCDEIFEKYDYFAAFRNEKGVDSSVFLFTPNLEQGRTLREIVYQAELSGKMDYSNQFDRWLQSYSEKLEKLDEEYNSFINSTGGCSKRLTSNISIVNFGEDAYPLDLDMSGGDEKRNGLGPIEKFLADLHQQLNMKDGKTTQNLHTDLALQFEVFKKEPIAIVGMSFRLPGGNSAEEFWNLLINGKEGIIPLPPSRWRKEHTLCPPKTRNVEAGFLTVPVDEFDAEFFGVGEAEAELMDPQTRLLHEVTWEALEEAMIDPRSIRGTQTGVFIGTWLQDYRDMLNQSEDKDFFPMYKGSSVGTGAAALSQFLEVRGPSIGTESGCSSAIAALDMACKSLRCHDSNLALACGVNLLLHPFDYDTLSVVLSPEGRCKTFDDGANGFGRAEGCAVLLLKRLSDAVHDGDNIWGLIRGSAATQEGVSKSLGTPTIHCESLAMEMALKDAGVDPLDVSYVEAHGTGTPVGDPMEIAAITKAYGKGRSDHLVIGSVKTNVGHTESVSGITGIIKVLLSMKNEIIPKHLNLKKLNPAINLESIPAMIPLESVAWAKHPGKPRIAGVSSFGISGTDGHAIIQEPPEISIPHIHEDDIRPLHIMKISAKSPQSFKELLMSYENLLSLQETEGSFADIAYSANIGRATFNHRAIIIAKNSVDAMKALTTKSFKSASDHSSSGRLCFIFPGGGSYYPKMGATLYASSPIFRDAFDKCDQILTRRFNINLRETIWNQSSDRKELNLALYRQTSTFCIQYCLFKLWASWVVKPDYVMGHGLGEYTAAVAAGVMSLENALMLIFTKSRLMDKHPRDWQSDRIFEAYRKIARNMIPIKTGKGAPRYISGMDGKLIDLESINGDYWVRHVVHLPVIHRNAFKVANLEHCHLFLEISSDPVTPKKDFEGHSVTYLRSIAKNEDEWASMLDSLGQLYLSNWKGEVDWRGFDKHYPRSRVPLPFYTFNRKPIWKELNSVLPIIHPLLGRQFPTASSSTIFSSSLTLKNTSFALDHVIGDTVIFPGAGFLEMCLAGGNVTVYGTGHETGGKPKGPVALKSLRIAAPLALYDSGVCRLQTVVKLDKVEGEGQVETKCYSVGVHRYLPSSSTGLGDWISHASAKFLPVHAPPSQTPVDIPSIQTSWEKVDNTDFYEKLPEVGLRFGPKFQSLEHGWRSETGLLLSVKVPEDNNDAYLIHPVIADAMLQATMLWTSKDKVKMKLQVPVQVEEFVWLQATSSPSRYIYCSTNEKGYTDCILLDDQGNHLAQISGVDFIETSVKLVEGMLQQQSTSMTKVWQESWKSTPGSLQNAYDLTKTKEIPPLRFDAETTEQLYALNDIGDYERSFYSNLCHLARYFFLKALYDLGWEPKQGVSFTVEDLTKLLPQPKEHFIRYIRFLLRSVAETGMIKTDPKDDSKYYFEGPPPSIAEIDKCLRTVANEEDRSRVEYQMVVKTGSNLSQVWLGKVEPLQLLFPDDPNQPNASQFYSASFHWVFKLLKSVNEKLFLPIMYEGFKAYMKANKVGSSSASPPVFRVLEVGAGTGAITKDFLSHLETTEQPYEYHFTDISASFFNPAEKELEKYLKNIVFKKFNMEEDPFAQGFCPRYFDMILACEVIHVAKDIRKTLHNLKTLLKPGGLFEIVETTQPCLRITQIFGMLDGFWQFEDLDFRPYHVNLTPAKWEQALRETGCDQVVCTPSYNNVYSVIAAQLSPKKDFYSEGVKISPFDKPQYSWLIFYNEGNAPLMELLKQKLKAVNRQVHTVKRPIVCTEGAIKDLMKSKFTLAKVGVERVEGVVYLWGMSDDITERDQSLASLPMINLLQEMVECKVPPRLYVVTQGTAHVDGYEVTSPTSATLHGIIKSISNENHALHVSCLDLSPDVQAVDQVGEIFGELWWTDKGNRSIAFRNNNRLFSRFNSAKFNHYEPLTLPGGCDRFQLLLPETRMISDLEFGVLEHFNLAENEVEIQIKAMALNFRDIFTVLKPIKQFEHLNTVGLDFAGVVTKVGSEVVEWHVGDQVIGMNRDDNLSLPSHIRMEENFVVPLPPSFTFEEGVTLPAVFLTAFHCLLKVAKMKRGDSVLIHTASGGVGLCAIQLAKIVGAEVFATAGSKRKQNYLRNLGIKHIFHSRMTNFGKQILEVTNGRGVDIVLNSLTGEGFKEASLSALKKDGWFVEMSKLNVWTPEQVKALRPDVSYEVVDLTALERSESQDLINQLKEFLTTSLIHPIPYERFDGLNIRGALNHLQKAKHIGKIVCRMPEVKVENSKVTVTTPLFNENSTYLVTGGLGGIGLEVVKWMLGSGAKHIAIASRSKPKPEIVSQLESWNRNGKHVEAFSVDIGDFDQCRNLFQELKSPSRGFPQLRGVMHAAGVLADEIVENQTWAMFNHTYNPKVNGTWNLHDLTKDLLLEHFVLFSSLSATFGTPGQTNHAASNSFEDSLAAYRRSNGLPATTINWGNWGEVGVATELDLPGIRPISTSQGIFALETILKTQSSHLSVVNLESCALAVKMFPNLKSFIDDKRLFGDLKASVIINSDEFWKDVDNAEDREGKVAVFKTFIKATLRNILKMDRDEVVDDLAEFQSLGIDSLMMLEMKNGIQNILGNRMILSASQLKDCNNTQVLANRLVDILQGEDNASPTNLPTLEELKELVRDDSNLPEHIRPGEGMAMKDVSEIESVLLTGATGVLGPYLLRDLSTRPTINKIYCLIRKSGKLSPMERLLKRLKAVSLEDQVDTSKVECIQGDITDDKFGLPEEEYNKLAGHVDAIINSAVRADHTVKYCKSDTRKLDIRAVNVQGTVRLLEFAVQSKLKHFYHASTLLSVTAADAGGNLSEEWQDVGAFDQLPSNGGYPLSKHIAEQLCRQAVERGIPCKAFRHPFIAGDSKTGRCDYLTNHFMLRWLAYMKLRCMPDLPSPFPAIPVDHCAQISLDIFFNGKAPNDVYNIMHPEGGMDQSIIEVAEGFGIHVEPVSINQFMAKLKLESDDSPLASFKKMYEEEEEAAIQNWETNLALPALKQYVEDSTNFFKSVKLPRLISYYDELESTEVVMTRDLRFLKELGVFQKFGIKQ